VNIERGSSSASVIDVLDRVLDKGIVIDAWVRVSVVGIDLVTVEARVVVASIETFMRYSDLMQRSPSETTVKQLPNQGRQIQLTDAVPWLAPTPSIRDGSPPRARRATRARRK
jgi:Gas vesicle protein